MAMHGHHRSIFLVIHLLFVDVRFMGGSVSGCMHTTSDLMHVRHCLWLLTADLHCILSELHARIRCVQNVRNADISLPLAACCSRLTRIKGACPNLRRRLLELLCFA